MIEVLNMETMINTDYVQSVDKKNDSEIVITMADGRIYTKTQTWEEAMRWFLSAVQHPKAIHKVQIIE